MLGNAGAITARTRLAAVIGDPIRHSMSPSLHNAAFSALSLDWVYLAFAVEAGRAPAAVEAMRALGLDGLSVTMPHKEAVVGLLDERSDTVEKLLACNCIARDGSRLVGHNTDGAGFVTAFSSHFDQSLADARVAVLGAGGAARSIVLAAADDGASQVDVINRSPERAEVAAELSTRARVGSFEDISLADVVVNATSVGMTGGPEGSPVPDGLLNASQYVVDIVYEPRQTKLLTQAEAIGASTLGGLPMLVHQAAVAFELWTGIAAPVDRMTDAALARLASS